MPELNDFYAFKMTTHSSGGHSSNNSSGSGNGIGCGGATVILMAILIILWIIGNS